MTEQRDDTSVLREMLALSQRLTETADAMLAGQYAYLSARIEALIELQAFGAAADA